MYPPVYDRERKKEESNQRRKKERDKKKNTHYYTTIFIHGHNSFTDGLTLSLY